MSKLSLYPITLDGDSTEMKREEIKNYFLNTFELYERVFELLKDDTVFYEKSELTRHPMIFYFGHTATFFVNKLMAMKIINDRINPAFESIFAVGVDEMAWDDVDVKNYDFPSVDEVRKYRVRVKKLVLFLIENLPLTMPIAEDSPMWIILMGIEHERIHIETSLVLHRQMPLSHVKDVSEFPTCKRSDDAPRNKLVHVEALHVELGKTKEHHLYGWDNEYGVYSEDVKEFQTSKYLVSNGEYMEFVESDGYKCEEYWDEEGLNYLKDSSSHHPHFWIATDEGYMYRTLSSVIEMPLNFPVEVNALEAEAFCRFKSKKDGVIYQLPSEVEYRAIYEQSGLQDVPDFHESRANINFYHYASSCPVDEFSFNGIFDVVGNVWQWSRTPIRGFDGFAVHEAYDDFSVPTFDERHSLILGSSWASSGNLMMKHSRYAFRKHFPQFTGFRYVVSANTEQKEDDTYRHDNQLHAPFYESDELVAQYCEFQYGDMHFGVKNFAVEMARIASSYSINTTKALDLGCATGRATFELAKSFDEVEGVDFSVRFVGVGAKLKERGFVAFHSHVEGDIVDDKKVTIEELGYKNLKTKVSFWQGDACNLKANFNSYDLVMATNLIDRLYNPRLFLDTIDERLNKDGVLVIASPYTWQQSSTNKELWLGGFVDEDGAEVRTINSLKKVLDTKFELLHVEDLEFVIKETSRKFQHTVSEVSVWKKR